MQPHNVGPPQMRQERILLPQLPLRPDTLLSGAKVSVKMTRPKFKSLITSSSSIVSFHFLPLPIASSSLEKRFYSVSRKLSIASCQTVKYQRLKLLIFMRPRQVSNHSPPLSQVMESKIAERHAEDMGS